MRLEIIFSAGGATVSFIQVLVVGSDVGNRTALVNILEECGLEPVIASNVEEAGNILARRPTHVVFCEDNLPDGSFREILRLVRATRPDSQVVVSSKLGDVDQYIEAMILGAFDFIAPPYRDADVISVIDSACDRYRLKRKDESFLYIQTGESPAGGGSMA
jgi:DNA-binding NtrC family response regulator